MSDNGGEFNNELLRELCEKLNISVKSTVAEAPWSNGKVEQHNAALGKMMNKLLPDNYCQYPIDVIVSWAVSAKNELHTSYSFSPNQLVFRRNPNLPSKLINLSPTIEDVSKTDIVVKHLKACSKKGFY